jgi:hypothetical protein
VKSCNAKIYVDESQKVLLKSDGVHNHEVCKNLERNIITNSLKRKANEELSERPVKLIHKERERKTPTRSEKLNSLDIYSIRKRIYDARRQVVPQLPKTMHDIHEAINAIAVKTNRQEEFVLVNDATENLLIFSTTTNLK